ncbi:MAG: hypothetical protein ACO3G9_06690 [Chthoniobacterales bacterium]|jgi:hypothetical protein
MSVLLWGLGVPTLVLVAQILVWRIRRPAADSRVLALMLAAALVGFVSLAVFPLPKAAMLYPDSAGAVLYALVLAGAVSLLYLITYATLEAKSPSTLIVLAAQETKEGLTVDSAAALFGDDEFIGNRIEGLEQVGQIRREDGQLFLTLHGRLFLEVFVLPRRLMGLGHWGG